MSQTPSSPLPGQADAVIVGGGINGAASAFFLSRAGLRPVIVERLPALAALTTSRSMEAMRAQFVEPENVAMMRESIAFYEDFAQHTGLPGHTIGIHQQGYLFLTGHPSGADALRQRVEGQHWLGLRDVEFLTGDEVRRRFPFVGDEALAGTFRQKDGWISAHEAAFGLARASGAQVVLRTAVTGFALSGGRIAGVHTTAGHIATPIVVIAAGPYFGRVAALLDVDLRLRIIRRHRVTIGQHPLVPQHAPMVIDQDTGAHWRPEKPGAALAWAQAHEPAGEPVDDVRPNPMFVHEVMEAVSRFCPFWIDVAESLKAGQVYLSAGQYTVSLDDKPIIGPHPGLSGLYFNGGYSGHGIMGAPGGGRLLADLVTGTVSDQDNPFSFRRLEHLSTEAGHQRLL